MDKVAHRSSLDNGLPFITVLIAARPNQMEIKAVNAARLLDYPKEKLEIIVARGKQPSVQRNTAMHAAKGEWIYFLDDDSVPPTSNLKSAVGVFKSDDRIKMLGGPNLCPADAPMLEQVFALVHGAWLAFFSSRARYASVGKVRESGEKELILCNLMAKRDVIIELGGFNEALYPNEENALMDELQKHGAKLIYDPEFIVYRRPRNNLKAFCKMLLNYGRGRAEQIKLHPTLGSAPNLIPPFFCVYLAALMVIGIVCPNYAPITAIPFVFYLLILMLQTLALMPRGGLIASLYAMPLIFLTHFLYGIGFWKGLFTPLKKLDGSVKTAVALETIAI